MSKYVERIRDLTVDLEEAVKEKNQIVINEICEEIDSLMMELRD